MSGFILNILPVGLREYMNAFNLDGLEEIRLRVNRNVILDYGKKKGELVADYIVTSGQIMEALEYITTFSLYAYESDIRQGFITIKGGHRVGLAGKVVLEDGKIKTISNISSINIRVSHQVLGCGAKIMGYIKNGDSIHNTLIISPPGAGKTTLLRDMLRILSDELKLKVSIVDERSEIASCYKGVPANEVGLRTDIYDCCPKVEGIMLMIRAMSPQVLAVDEIGGAEDVEALIRALHAGIKVVATVHGKGVYDIDDRLKIYHRYICLDNIIDREISVYDENFVRLY